MSNNPRRLVGFFALLLGIWVVTYWLWQPSPPAISFGQPAAIPPPRLASVERTPIETAPQAVPNRPGATPADAGNANRTGPMVQVMEKPRFREYTVQKGDTSFETIAARAEVYGDRKLARAIESANPLVSPHKLIPGRTVLKIPVDPTNIQGKVVSVPSPSPKPVEPLVAPKPAAEEFYTVQAGDTLSGIAKARYGRSAMWEAILEANRDQLSDPARIKAGMVLRMPPVSTAPAKTQ